MSVLRVVNAFLMNFSTSYLARTNRRKSLLIKLDHKACLTRFLSKNDLRLFADATNCYRSEWVLPEMMLLGYFHLP